MQLFQEMGHLQGIELALSYLGWALHDRGDLERGAELMGEALELARDLGDRVGIMESLGHLGVITYRRGDFERARRLLEEQLALARELGSSADTVFALIQLGVTARYAGDLAQAQVLLEEGLRLTPQPAPPFYAALVRRYQADVLFDQGNIDGAARIYRESLAVFRDLGAKWDCASCLEALAAVAGAQRQTGRAVRLWSSAVAIREAIGAPLPPVDRPRRDTALADLRVALGTTSFQAVWSEAAALPMEQVITDVLEGPGEAR